MERRLRVELAILLLAASVWVLKACGYITLPGGLTFNAPLLSAAALPPAELRQRIALPPGFSIGRYAAVPEARFLLFTDAGDLLVSSTRRGTVFLVGRRSGDGSAGPVRVLLDHLNQPHGLAYHDGWLYVAETSGVLRVRFDPASGTVSGAPEPVVSGLPSGGNHWTRTVHIGPDGRLYVSIGSSCNVCIEDDKRRATIMRFALDGSGGEIYASGLRNAVDFDWQPGTGALYATDNGRDLLGDDFPPCELDRIVQGGFYGWPFANGDRVPDPDQGAGHAAEIAASIPPAHAFGAHVAPLGITFYTPPPGAAPATFPPAYRGAAFVAQHGSWNRSRKSGYQVVALRFRPDGTISEEPFATGFMIDEQVSGRPVDVAVGPDGALYVSDDFTGSIYRIAYGQAAAADAAPVIRPSVRDALAGLDRPTIEAARTRGQGLWNAQPCATCHAAAVAAPDAYRPLAALASKYDVDALVAYLRTPQPPMPAIPLSDEQRRDLAIYLLTTYP